MPRLADIQAAVRGAVVDGATPAALAGDVPLLSGGRRPEFRLAIHHRHYVTSLVTALLDRFPATVWLVGSDLVTQAAQAYVRAHPPSRPCIAEYGEDFPVFLGACPASAGVPYLTQFAMLEWHLGRLALAVDTPAIDDVSVFAASDPDCAGVDLQPGVAYLHLDWGLDDLVRFFLTDTAPEQHALSQGDIWLELRGVRGVLHLSRLPEGDYAFRAALASGATVSDAALEGISRDATFDPGSALASLVADGLVTTVRPTRSKETA